MNVLLFVAAFIPSVEIVDDAGRTSSMAAWTSVPTVVVPMYTRCPLACPMIVSAMTRATGEAKALPATYRVVLFSFDPRDTPADLRAFRQRHRVPLSWTVATARPDDIRRLMESLGFTYTSARGEFLHPNRSIVLSPELVPAKTIAGTDLSGGELDAALSIARGGTDWIGRYGAAALAALLVLAALAAVYLGRFLVPRSQCGSAAVELPPLS